MKNRRHWFFCIPFVFLAAMPHRLNKWVRFAVDKQLSVLLPRQPQELPSPNPLNKSYSTRDLTGTYIVLRKDLGPDFTIGTGRNKELYRDAFYRGISKRLIENYHGVVLDSARFTRNGYSGKDLTVRFRTSKDNKLVLQHMRCLLVGRVAYMLEFLPADTSGSKGSLERSRFFESLVLKSKPAKN